MREWVIQIRVSAIQILNWDPAKHAAEEGPLLEEIRALLDNLAAHVVGTGGRPSSMDVSRGEVWRERVQDPPQPPPAVEDVELETLEEKSTSDDPEEKSDETEPEDAQDQGGTTADARKDTPSKDPSPPHSAIEIRSPEDPGKLKEQQSCMGPEDFLYFCGQR